MALFKDTGSSKEFPPPPPKDPFPREVERSIAPAPDVRRHDGRADTRESLIGSELSIEGKILGVGHVRVAGKFKGDIQVDGNLSIDAGAQVNGQVKARNVTIAGELQGNIEGAIKVELLETGVLVGDVKASSLTVAAGSRMRGQVEFGWENQGTTKFESRSTGTGT
jgi:cytoskeletal protein CcmA (bactofilin family)